jgi:hypothetical protein
MICTLHKCVISVIIISTGKQETEVSKMTDKKIKDFTKGIEEIAKLHPADQEKVFQMVADRNGAAAAGYIEKKVNDYETARNMLKKFFK